MKIFKHLARSPCIKCWRDVSRIRETFTERRHKLKGWSYVNQGTIENCASKSSLKVTPSQMLNAGRFTDGEHLIKNVQFLHNELVIRVARRLLAFHSLPYIVAVNPDISDTYELYIRSFNLLSGQPKIKDLPSERKFSKMVKTLLNNHRHVVTSLARGFKDCKHQVPYHTIHSFLDKTLKSRLGMRMLAEHHIALRENKNNFVGIIANDLCLKTVIERSADFVRQVCEHHYGVCPEIIINGHKDASFSYFPAPLEYILQELLKNAMRSTVEFHRGESMLNVFSMPSVQITISCNKENFTIRISDQGGGISDDDLKEVFNYSFSTFKKVNQTTTSMLSDYSQTVNSMETIGSMAGFGFGLPTSRAYAEFLGGSLQLQSLYGYGTDVYVKLKRIEGDQEGFRL
ncbi:3-methyl-2-oxobutanoate dehydrogenase [lipoamide] kinase, mitochondrial-like [Xenia sp. Carnegie-2017]|uniref:3-methyl-2-oxobutanoate dehydrogenase [lipoamide] kinase, mitochondrial-like n=1 Tax=Xenia sp. Carnegie-2017 TaxID=2897299 RepID=UPI001F036E34|nr:3-methyl-2-oxobutanoate dehydrogenase [lipoamide] kinase, mitochondrial-like [Xenia sp. Carnegie-2017]